MGLIKYMIVVIVAGILAIIFIEFVRADPAPQDTTFDTIISAFRTLKPYVEGVEDDGRGGMQNDMSANSKPFETINRSTGKPATILDVPIGWGDVKVDSADTGSRWVTLDVKSQTGSWYDSVFSKQPSLIFTYETRKEIDLRCLCGWRGMNFDLIWEGGPYQASRKRCPDCLVVNHLFYPENGNLHSTTYIIQRSWGVSSYSWNYGRRDWYGNLIPIPRPRVSPNDSVLAELRHIRALKRITWEWE